MAAGESQAWNRAASGSVSKSIFVRFSYALKALLKIRISRKLEDKEEVG